MVVAFQRPHPARFMNHTADQAPQGYRGTRARSAVIGFAGEVVQATAMLHASHHSPHKRANIIAEQSSEKFGGCPKRRAAS